MPNEPLNAEQELARRTRRNFLTLGAGAVAAAGLENLWEKAQRLVTPSDEEK